MRVLPWLWLIAGCELSGTAVPLGRASLPERVDFGLIRLGELASVQVEVRNDGLAELRADVSAELPFAVTDGTGLVVPAGGARWVELRVVVTDYAPRDGILLVTAGDRTWTAPIEARVDADADADGHLATGAGGGDCDDGDDQVFPGAVERCDGRDQDCDGLLDEDPWDAPLWFYDSDGDGFGSTISRRSCAAPERYVDNASDCDDANPEVYPGAPDPPYDGDDSDCAGDSDFDADGDGFDHSGYGGDDCDDANDLVHPEAFDPPYDGLDQDCDGWSDFDADQDGANSQLYGGTDCDDALATVRPGATEAANDVDDDCDGWIDENFVPDGALRITELLIDPLGPGGKSAQYVEISNRGDQRVWLVGGEFAASGGLSALPARALEPGASVVLCGSTDPSVMGAVPCDGLLAASLAADDRASVAIGRELDALPLVSLPPPTPGAASALDLESEAWCVASAAYAPGYNRGSPGIDGGCP